MNVLHESSNKLTADAPGTFTESRCSLGTTPPPTAKVSWKIPLHPDGCGGDPEIGTLIVARDTRHSKLGSDDGLTTLIFKREDVGLEREYLTTNRLKEKGCAFSLIGESVRDENTRQMKSTLG